ncbi:4Fe-4S dicluster domain-containing protein [candidate division KSB1 bacterium]
MKRKNIKIGDQVLIDRNHLNDLITLLSEKGYRVIGPKKNDHAIIYDDIFSDGDLPIGWTDEQDAGSYRLKKRNDGAVFGFNLSPHSWKKYLYPPDVRLWDAHKSKNRIKINKSETKGDKFAFIGPRSCELYAIAILDKVFSNGQFTDSAYKKKRKNSMIVAINCTQAGGTCFCTSTGTGPKVGYGFDLCLTEVIEDERHYFIVDTGTEKGLEILNRIPHEEVKDFDRKSADKILDGVAGQMKRKISIDAISDCISSNLSHPVWENTASQCLSCGNCTLVCPTCFCTNIEDYTDLSGTNSDRRRKWDSCFSLDFSYIFGGSVRTSPEARYRQWFTHKFSSWQKQFGVLGCVGCGRCITWCPGGIDITDVLRKIQKSEYLVSASKL